MPFARPRSTSNKGAIYDFSLSCAMKTVRNVWELSECGHTVWPVCFRLHCGKGGNQSADWPAGRALGDSIHVLGCNVLGVGADLSGGCRLRSKNHGMVAQKKQRRCGCDERLEREECEMGLGEEWHSFVGQPWCCDRIVRTTICYVGSSSIPSGSGGGDNNDDV